MKVSHDHNLSVPYMLISVFDRIENIVEKAENVGCEQFHFFPTIFSEDLFSRVIRTRDCLEKG